MVVPLFDEYADLLGDLVIRSKTPNNTLVIKGPAERAEKTEHGWIITYKWCARTLDEHAGDWIHDYSASVLVPHGTHFTLCAGINDCYGPSICWEDEEHSYQLYGRDAANRLSSELVRKLKISA